MKCDRTKKDSNFTVISNDLVWDKELSGTAIHVMVMILSLPDNWDLTVKGLAAVSGRTEGYIRSAFRELTDAGYIERYVTRNPGGKFCKTEYIVHEGRMSVAGKKRNEEPQGRSALSESDSPCEAVPRVDSPHVEPPHVEFPTQSNTNRITNTDTNKSYPILSSRPDTPSGSGSFFIDAIRSDTIGMKNMQTVDEVTQEVKMQIDYDALKETAEMDPDFPDAVVALIAEAYMSKEEETFIEKEARSMEFVKARFRQINSEHLLYIFDRMKKSPNRIRNIRQYLRAALFNAPATMGAYYAMEVHQDENGIS